MIKTSIIYLGRTVLHLLLKGQLHKTQDPEGNDKLYI